MAPGAQKNPYVLRPISQQPPQFSSSSVFPALSQGFTISSVTVLGFFLKYSTVPEVIPSSWMVHAECVFVASTYPSRTRMSGSFESMRWNACTQRLDLHLCSHPKEFLGNGVRTRVNSKENILSSGGSDDVVAHDAA